MSGDVLIRPTSRPLFVIWSCATANSLQDCLREALLMQVPVLILCDENQIPKVESESVEKVLRLDLPRPCSAGAVLRISARWANEHHYSHLITGASVGFPLFEGTTTIDSAIDETPQSLIVGIRQNHVYTDSRVESFRRVVANFLLRMITGYDGIKMEPPIRIYPVEAVNRFATEQTDFMSEFEFAVRLVWAGIAQESIPLSPGRSHENNKEIQPISSMTFRRALTYGKLIVRQCLPWPHHRIFNRESHGLELSWRHPFRSLLTLHRRVYRKLGEGEKQLSLRHPIRSLKILHLERISAREIALACFLGILIGSSPLLGFHTIAIIFYATRFRLNRAIAFYISHPCAPVFPPFVPAWEIEVGFYFRNGRFITLEDVNTRDALFQTLGMEAHLRLWEYFIGWLVVGPLLAAAVGFLVYNAAVVYQRYSHKENREP